MIRRQPEPKAGDVCSCCEKVKLRAVNQALVCLICDHAHEWKVSG